MDLSKIPASDPPPGIVPNFNDPPSRRPVATVMVSVTLALMVLFVVLRLYADLWVLRKLEKASCAYFFAFILLRSRFTLLIHLTRGLPCCNGAESFTMVLQNHEAHRTMYRSHL